MKKLSDNEVTVHFDSITKRHRWEMAESVRLYCIGRTAKQLADLLGRDNSWVFDYLDLSCAQDAVGEERLELDTMHVKGIRKKFGPDIPDARMYAQFHGEGFLPPVAKRIAMTTEAVTKAMDAGELITRSGGTDETGQPNPVRACKRLSWESKYRQRVINPLNRAAKALEDTDLKAMADQADEIAEADRTWRAAVDADERWQRAVERVRAKYPAAFAVAEVA